MAGVGLSGVDADIIREILASKHKPNSRRDFSFAAMTQLRISIVGEARRKVGFSISYNFFREYSLNSGAGNILTITFCFGRVVYIDRPL